MMTFGQALEAVKQGQKVQRMGWNGKGMYIMLQPVELSPQQKQGEWLKIRSWIGMRTVDAEYVPWVASQTDLLAEDWVEIS